MKTAREIENEAVRWIVRNDKGELAHDEVEAFESWLAADVRHRAAYVRQQAAWRRETELGKLMRPYGGRVDADLLKRPGHPLPSRRRFALALAGGVALVAIGIATVFTLFQRDSGWETVDTGFGDLTEVALADGTRVHLNSETEMRVRVTARMREVVVVRGEVRFDVAPDTTRPFEVAADGAVVRAVGTAFAVRIHDRRLVDVIVEQGTVSVALVGRSDTKPRFFSAGHSVRVRSHTIAFREIDSDEVDRQLAWTEGSIELFGDTLEAAVAEFNRYNRRQLVIADPAIAARTVSGRFDRHGLDEFVEWIDSLGVRAESGAKDASAGEIRLYKK